MSKYTCKIAGRGAGKRTFMSECLHRFFIAEGDNTICINDVKLYHITWFHEAEDCIEFFQGSLPNRTLVATIRYSDM